MKIRFIVDTTWNGLRKRGDELDVPTDVADRWIKNNIAVLAEAPKRAGKNENQDRGNQD